MEKFKTKYHALAWAAEHTENIFVDNAGMSFRVAYDVILRQCASDGIWNSNVDVDMIKEPCRKAQPIKGNWRIAEEI